MKLRELREQKGLTQAEVGERIGVKGNTISQWEAGTRRPSPEKAKKIAEELGFDWTLFYEE